MSKYCLLFLNLSNYFFDKKIRCTIMIHFLQIRKRKNDLLSSLLFKCKASEYNNEKTIMCQFCKDKGLSYNIWNSHSVSNCEDPENPQGKNYTCDEITLKMCPCQEALRAAYQDKDINSIHSHLRKEERIGDDGWPMGDYCDECKACHYYCLQSNAYYCPKGHDGPIQVALCHGMEDIVSWLIQEGTQPTETDLLLIMKMRMHSVTPEEKTNILLDILLTNGAQWTETSMNCAFDYYPGTYSMTEVGKDIEYLLSKGCPWNIDRFLERPQDWPDVVDWLAERGQS